MKLKDFLTYPAKIEKDATSPGFNVVVRDLPAGYTCGDSFEDALDMGISLIMDIGNSLSSAGIMVPTPSPLSEGDVALNLNPVTAFKIILRNEMSRKKIKASQLAKDMGVSQQVMSSYLTYTRTNTQLSTLIAIAEAIGLTVDIDIA